MKDTGQTNLQNLKIKHLLEGFLQFRTPADSLTEMSEHLDEDGFTAFIEGNIGEREARPILTHLVNCSFCLNVTAELVKLDYAFAEDEIRVGETGAAPSKVSDVLSRLLSRIFGANDDVVFAHQESEEEIEKIKDKENEKK